MLRRVSRESQGHAAIDRLAQDMLRRLMHDDDDDEE
jgi:hypothetical protein